MTPVWTAYVIEVSVCAKKLLIVDSTKAMDAIAWIVLTLILLVLAHWVVRRDAYHRLKLEAFANTATIDSNTINLPCLGGQPTRRLRRAAPTCATHRPLWDIWRGDHLRLLEQGGRRSICAAKLHHERSHISQTMVSPMTSSSSERAAARLELRRRRQHRHAALELDVLAADDS